MTAITESIPDLRWANNYCAETGSESYTIVANPGPLVTDFHLWLRDSYEAYILHVGQEDRFTFIGDPNREITGHFVDCRKGSASLHARVTMNFAPDPRQVLHIPQGVAAWFGGLMHVTVRSEPIWFAPSKKTPYEVGNDQIRIADSTDTSEFPEISVNDLPLPDQVLQLICKRQQKMLRDGDSYNTSFGVPNGDDVFRFQA